MTDGNLYKRKYVLDISSQWDPLNPRDYLLWPVYDGPEAWAASCRFSDTIKICLAPMMESHIKLQNEMNMTKVNNYIIPALYFITLSEHQSILTDPRTNNAKCVHQRMLSDDVLRCQGLLNWYTGNQLLIINIHYIDQWEKLFSNLRSSIFECIYITVVTGDMLVALRWKQ